MTTTTAAPAQQEDIAEVWVRYKQDPTNKMLRNRLVEQYLPLVKYNGERIWSRLPEGVDLDDLISAGVFGLMDAINAFDMSRGVKFETYCVPRIRGAMLDELRTMDWVPRLVRSKASRLNEAIKFLEARLGRTPSRNERLVIILYYYEELTMKEIGATLDLSESRVSQMHSAIVQRLQNQLGMRRPEFGAA